MQVIIKISLDEILSAIASKIKEEKGYEINPNQIELKYCQESQYDVHEVVSHAEVTLSI